MTITTAIEQIKSIIEEMKQAKKEDGEKEEEEQTEEKYENSLTDPAQILCIAACRVTSKSEKFVVGSMAEFARLEPDYFGPPLHSLIILGHHPLRKSLNPLEIEFLAGFAIDKQAWRTLTAPSGTQSAA